MVIIICRLILPCGLKNTAYVETGFQVSLYISLCAFCVLIILSYPFSLSYRIVEGDKTILKIGHFKTYSQVPLQRGLIYHDITYGTAITVTESESVIRNTKDTLTGELCGVNFEDFGENWPCYNDTALYNVSVCYTRVIFATATSPLR